MLASFRGQYEVFGGEWGEMAVGKMHQLIFRVIELRTLAS
jgi:hypothetical protein